MTVPVPKGEIAAIPVNIVLPVVDAVLTHVIHNFYLPYIICYNINYNI